MIIVQYCAKGTKFVHHRQYSTTVFTRLLFNKYIKYSKKWAKLKYPRWKPSNVVTLSEKIVRDFIILNQVVPEKTLMKNVHMFIQEWQKEKNENLKREGKMRISIFIFIYTYTLATWRWTQNFIILNQVVAEKTLTKNIHMCYIGVTDGKKLI